MRLSSVYDPQEEKVYILRFLVLVVALVVVIWLVVMGFVGLRTASAGILGRASAHRQIESGTNRISQYEHFFNLSADYQSDVQQLHVAETEQLGQQVITGISFHCIGLSNQYNADAQEYTRNQFLSSQLPTRLDSAACNPQGAK